ncbi:MAG: 2-phosphosulfolactate phosphatase, partial [Ignavibacteria bacterium]|nr:2-phosphosulfolactate phosphatase [Ignavibacteria bacterium]
MRVEVLFTLQNILEGFFLEKNVIVIDLLRATSTIVTALNNSAKEIIPVESVAEAVKISKNQEKGTYLLAGEKNAKMIEGFDLGNSPL